MKNLLSSLRSHNRLHISLLLVVFSIFSTLLSLFRIYYSGQLTFAFMFWNLFLAWIPYIFSIFLLLKEHKLRYRILILPIVGAWLLFFPNAPYILTDLFHLRQRTGMPLWYDLVLLSSFAWTGLFLGLISLRDIQKVITKHTSAFTGWMFAFAAIGAGSFGIYLGRYQRWNSWDIATNPFGLAHDIASHLLHPFQHSRTVGVTLLFTIFLALGYLTLYYLNGHQAGKDHNSNA